jgi:flavin reductase ActVB
MAAARPETKQSETVVDNFRVAMSRLATGVVMVTCHVDGKPWGLTVSACCSVSMDPLLLLVSLGQDTASAHAIRANQRFGVSVLGESLIDVARFGAARGAPKFVHEYCHTDERRSETPVVASALAHVDCAVDQEVPAGDHVIYIGRVQNVVLSDGERPLVYYGRGYHQLGDSTDLHVGPAHEETIDSLLYDYPLPRQFSRVESLGR